MAAPTSSRAFVRRMARRSAVVSRKATSMIADGMLVPVRKPKPVARNRPRSRRTGRPRTFAIPAAMALHAFLLAAEERGWTSTSTPVPPPALKWTSSAYFTRSSFARRADPMKLGSCPDPEWLSSSTSIPESRMASAFASTTETARSCSSRPPEVAPGSKTPVRPQAVTDSDVGVHSTPVAPDQLGHAGEDGDGQSAGGGARGPRPGGTLGPWAPPIPASSPARMASASRTASHASRCDGSASEGS